MNCFKILLGSFFFIFYEVRIIRNLIKNCYFVDIYSEDDKSVSSESSEGSDNYLDNVLIRKEGL